MKILKRALLVLLLLVVATLVVLYLRLRKESYAIPELSPIKISHFLTQKKQWMLGKFRFQWTPEQGQAQLSITHTAMPTHILWKSVPGQSWLATARGKAAFRYNGGAFSIKNQVEDRCEQQRVNSIKKVNDSLQIKGMLYCIVRKNPIPYEFEWKAVGNTHLQFIYRIKNENYNRTYFRYASSQNEHFFGFGEQFTFFDLKGKRIPILARKQGIGRGLQPVTWASNLRTNSGGDWYTSGASVPHYITSQMRSLFLENNEYSIFDLRPKHFVQVALFSKQMKGRILFGQTPLKLIEAYTIYSGRMRKLPDWIHQGAIIDLQGGTKKAKQILQKLKHLKAPIAAFWFRDWTGQRTTNSGKYSWWNWTLDRKHYPKWKSLVNLLKEVGAKVLLYINPFLVDVKNKSGSTRNLFKEAKEKGLFLTHSNKKMYILRNSHFSAGLLDLTKLHTQRWLKQIMTKEMIKIGASGWMADFGETLPFDAKLAHGATRSMHNQYPELWAKINREAIDETGRGSHFVFFMRTGFTQSPKYNTLFSQGKQLVTWDRHDGIKTAITSLLSGGISGFSLNHSGIGGETTMTHFFQNYHRSQELHMRWAELSAFTTVYRTQEGSQPSKNHQFYSSPKTLKHFVRFAKIYKAWGPYRKRLVEQAAVKGYPVVRHPFIHYPNDPRFYRMHHAQFMIGPKWMVVPTLNFKQKQVKVYLPVGKWKHLWTGRIFGSHKKGMNFSINAPLGQPAMFYQVGDPDGEALRRFVQNKLSKH